MGREQHATAGHGAYSLNAARQDVVIGVILAVTAMVVLVPVVLQMRTDGRRLRDVWGHFVFVAGLLAVAAAYAFLAGGRQQVVSLAGLALAVGGLFVQHRDRDSDDVA